MRTGCITKIKPFFGEYELASPDSAPKYNPYSNEYEIVPDTFEPTFNPYSGEYEMHQGDCLNLILTAASGSLFNEGKKRYLLYDEKFKKCDCRCY